MPKAFSPPPTIAARMHTMPIEMRVTYMTFLLAFGEHLPSRFMKVEGTANA
jgi:hypothetical protein